MPYLGKTPSQGVRSRYQFTPNAGTTSISGADANGDTLTFTDGNYVDVYLNGVMLKAGTDYVTTTANTIGSLAATVASDVVDIIVYDTFSVFGGTIEGNVKVNNGTLNVTGATDLDSTLNVDGAITSSAGATISTTGQEFQLILTSTDADALQGPRLKLYRNSSSPADGDATGEFTFVGRNDNSQDVDYFQIRTDATDVSDGSEDATVHFFHMRDGTIRSSLTFAPTETIFNDDHRDLDFRVESDTIANALFVDGATGNVGIGATPATWNSGNTALQIGGNGTLHGSTAAGAGKFVALTQNAHIDSDGSWEYISTDEASNYYQDGGAHYFRSVASGTAGNDITWLSPFTISTYTSEPILTVKGGGYGYTHGAIALTSHTGEDPRVRGQGIYLFNEENDTTWYVGTSYQNTSAGSRPFDFNFKSSTTSLSAITAHTDNTKARIHASGVISAPSGIELGSGLDATAANTLDDYEEGTWTPAFVDQLGNNNPTVTYDGQVGRYTKIGNICFAHFHLGTDSVSGGSSSVMLAIGGLPFTSASDDARGHISFGYKYDWPGNQPAQGSVFSSNTVANLWQGNNAGSNITTNDLGTGANSNRFNGTIIYKTA